MPHMISSATTGMPRALASAQYALSRSLGQGMAATEDPHWGSTSNTPISLA